MGDIYYEEKFLDDLDFLLTEECIAFMEAAPAPVKESFSNRIVASLHRVIAKIQETISNAFAKFRGKQIDDVLEKHPELKNKKIEKRNYKGAQKLGQKALKDLDRAKSKGEADAIVTKYKKERAKILGKSILVGLTVAGGVTFATLVAADYKNAKNRLEFIKNEPLSHAERLGNIENEIGQVTGELRHMKMTDADHKYLNRLNNQRWAAKKDLRDSLIASQKASVAKIMANDVKDDFLSTINGIRNLVSKHIPKSNKSKPQEG